MRRTIRVAKCFTMGQLSRSVPENDSVNRVLIGVLGYGPRAPQVESLLSLAGKPERAGVLVFWNSPDQAVSTQLRGATERSAKLEVRMSPENLGSAGGYRRLLEWAGSRTDWDYLLLLDDDLAPQAGCIESLVKYAGARREHDDNTLYLAYRRDLSELAALVETGKPLAEIRPGSCVGFHAANLLGRPGPPSSHVDHLGIRLDAAPYGGLLVPRPALARLGLPIGALFLYADDAELTLRFTRGGGTIWLVPEAVIADRSPSWNAIASRGGNLARRVLHLDDTKAYFEARNRNFLSRRFHAGRAWTYQANKAAFLLAVHLLAIAHGRPGRARLIHRAIVDGEAMAREDH